MTKPVQWRRQLAQRATGWIGHDTLRQIAPQVRTPMDTYSVQTHMLDIPVATKSQQFNDRSDPPSRI